MTKEAIRIACAEECGWKDVHVRDYELVGKTRSDSDLLFVPNYPEDANAALSLVTLLAKEGWRCSLENGLDTAWECTFIKPVRGSARAHVAMRDGTSTEEHYGAADTLAGAVCEGFLKVRNRFVEDKI